MTRVQRLVGLTLASAALSGCFLWTSAGEGSSLREATDAHERRLAALEQASTRNDLREDVEHAKTQVAKLQELLERATSAVTRTSADTGQQVETLQTQLATLEGQLAELQNSFGNFQRELQAFRSDVAERLEKASKRPATGAGGEPALDPSQIPAEKTEHFAAAYRAYQAGDYVRARALFREYIVRYASDDQADNAQYWVGKTFMQESRPSQALGEYRTVLSQFGRGDALDETLLDMAEAFWLLRACDDARRSAEALIQAHPDSPLVAQARQRVRQAERPPRNYCNR